MHEIDAQLVSALRSYVTMVIRGHADLKQFDRAYMRGELTFRLEYESETQVVKVSGVNRAGAVLTISERKLGT